MNDVKLADYFNNPELFVGYKTTFFGKICGSQNYDHNGLIGKIFTIELDSEKSEVLSDVVVDSDDVDCFSMS
ncbi:MAG: hypothetical protein EZS28_046705, partial [Streblomastix strix]